MCYENASSLFYVYSYMRMSWIDRYLHEGVARIKRDRTVICIGKGMYLGEESTAIYIRSCQAEGQAGCDTQMQ
jgi:hypothetical protein